LVRLPRVVVATVVTSGTPALVAAGAASTAPKFAARTLKSDRLIEPS
jgi:hypothetical protein